MEKNFGILMLWVVNIFFSCSGFSCEWVIWEFAFKCAISSATANGYFSGC